MLSQNLLRSRALWSAQVASAQLAALSRALTTMKTSSLYIRGKEARNRRALVLPHLEIDKLVNDIPTIRRTLEARNIPLDISLLSTQLPSLRIVKNEFNRVQMAIMEITRILSDHRLLSASEKPESELRAELSSHYTTEREVKQSMYAKEEDVVPTILRIPNFIRAPTDNVSSLFKEYGNRPKFAFSPASHVDIGGSDIVFRDHPRLCYLKADPALLELSLIRYFDQKLSGLAGFEPVSSPDWVVDTVVEGCGKNPMDLDHTLVIESKEHNGGHQHHLVGSASFESFAAYMTRRQVGKLPACYYSLGRFYAAHCDALLPGLYSLAQSERASVFAACKESELENTFEELLVELLQWYKELKIPFRLRLVEPVQLRFIESLRVDIEVWSPALDSYVPCGWFSLHGDFVSRRLIMVHGAGASDVKFAHTLFGCVANIHCLAASIMENGQTKDCCFSFPAVLNQRVRAQVSQ
ncbi:serine--tRNA synthetase-like protein Slimp [Ixodes scapularis]|uniref:serine--tRNA synthetase-like protein Slimp n=1 Tax=Ixodes scapularis TaxID=6945 RepID=UPI001C394769|nr:serine--tRNA synthetase-like protein Slimp [Ixodes scapularis]